MQTASFEEVSSALNELCAEEGLGFVAKAFGSRAVFSSSLGIEDQVITYMISRFASDISIFTLDTGRLFQETYDLLDLTQKKYKQQIRTYFPATKDVETLLTTKGPNSFYDSVENRKECCNIRKVLPLRQALQNADIWVTGVRADQSDHRSAMDLVSWDAVHGVIKYNPLLKWTSVEVDQFIADHNIPVNTLHKKGFPSIGCAPCTRAILPGEDPRAGRWWWESSAKECGLHS